MTFIGSEAAKIRKEEYQSPVLSTTTTPVDGSKVETFSTKPLGTGDDFGLTQKNNVDANKLNRADINIDKQSKQYNKKKPTFFEEFGMNFNDEQRGILKKYIKDEETYATVLEFVKQEDLTEDDIIAGIEELENSAAKNATTQTNKAEKKEIKRHKPKGQRPQAHNRAHHMNEIRHTRRDMSSQALATLGRDFEEDPELKNDTNHFINAKNTDGSYRYNEKEAMEAHGYMRKADPKKRDAFMSNTRELECKKTKDGFNKYTGKTVVNVGMKMTDHEELKETMMLVADKSDMNDEYLVKTTDNLCENPYMEETIRFAATAKAEDGTDRFTAGNIYDTSNYLVTKDEDACSSYAETIRRIASNNNLSGSDIIDLCNMVDQNPEMRDELINRIVNSTGSADEIKESCSQYIAANKSEESSSSNLFNQSTNKTQTNNTTSNPISQNNYFATAAKKTNSTTDTSKIKIDGVQYNRSVLMNQLYSKFGSYAEKVLARMESDSYFVQLMKKYGNDKTIRNALVEDPQLVTKLKRISSTISISDLAEMVRVCKDQKSFEALKALSDLINPQYAAMYIKNSSRTNEILTVLDNNALSRKEKLDAIKNIS